jgi:hypothetical protein
MILHIILRYTTSNADKSFLLFCFLHLLDLCLVSLLLLNLCLRLAFVYLQNVLVA